MSPLRAVLSFPVRCGEASRALYGRGWPALFLFAPSVVGGVYLVARGCSVGDAGATSLAMALLLGALAAGGALAAWPAARLLGEAGGPARRVAACCVAAGWTGLLLPLAAAGMAACGVGPLAPLLAAILLLVWGVAAGAGIAGGSEVEGGRHLVAACVGLTGALGGAVAGVTLVTALGLPTVQPSPTAGEEYPAGTPLLLSRGEEVRPGPVYVAFSPSRRWIFRARGSPGGVLEPLDELPEPAAEGRPFQALGRVFFHFHGLGGPPGMSIRPNR